MTIENQLSLKEFETWLYGQEGLLSKLDQDFILELFTFNYNQNSAHYEFKKIFLRYFEKEEFLLWKVKSNLQDLVDGTESMDRILYEFHLLGYDEVPCLQSVGFYMYSLEEAEYNGEWRKSVIADLKNECKFLLQEIQQEETKNSDFSITSFKQVEIQPVAPVKLKSVPNENLTSNKWYQFWKR